MTVPFFCVLAALGLIYLPKLVASIAMAKMKGGYDNRHPRAQQAALEGWGARAIAAHHNGFEAFAPFAAAVLIAHVGGAPLEQASVLSILFLAARVAYIALYLANIHLLRSLVWTVGFGLTVALMLLPATR